MSAPSNSGGRWRGDVGRQVLVALYAIFALSAGARSLVQLILDPGRAPLAYGLSLLAAIVYLVATVALRRTSEEAHLVAITAVTFELAGVLIVGTLTIVDPELFPEPTVWSTFGIGYGFVPLVLPIAGLWWLLAQQDEPT